MLTYHNLKWITPTTNYSCRCTYSNYYVQSLRRRGPEGGFARQLPQPAYDYVLKCSHLFNLLDARGALSVSPNVPGILPGCAIWPVQLLESILNKGND